MTIRQCAGLEPTHQDIRLCGWTRATPEEVSNISDGRCLAALLAKSAAAYRRMMHDEARIGSPSECPRTNGTMST